MLIAALLLLRGTWADEHSHVYRTGEEVIAWANYVGPYANRQETYAYFQLPFCQGAKQHEHYHETLGEALQGMELVNTGIDIQFMTSVQRAPLCAIDAAPKQLRLFEYAIAYQYYFQMFIDNLPIGGMYLFFIPISIIIINNNNNNNIRVRGRG